MSVTYSEYLKLRELLSLQQPRSDGPEHDEMLFIVIHQVYELWFKEVLHELDHLKRLWEEKDLSAGLHTLDRMLKILKILVAQVDVLETMTPLEFMTFRHRLESASGFQSFQFRELEFALGQKNPSVLEQFPEGSMERRRLNRRLGQPSLWDAFLRGLSRRGDPVPDSLLGRDVTRPNAPSPEVQRILIDLYKNHPSVARVCERLVDFDEGLQEWRYRHVKMVERTIGSLSGTGGSSGVEYLKATLHKPNFPDLWSIRAEL